MALFRRRRRAKWMRAAAFVLIFSGCSILFIKWIVHDSPAAATYFNGEESHSQVIRVSYFSEALQVEKHFMIYLPPGYDEEKARYPVLYLLRGQEQEWFSEQNFNGNDKSRTQGTVKEVLDDLIRQKMIGKMIVVAPSMSSDVYVDTGLGVSEIVYSYGVNMIDPPSNVEGIGTGQFEDYFIDLIHYVDKNYRTLKSEKYRSIDGFSTGGFIALQMAIKHTDLFSLVGSYESPVFTATGIDDLSDQTLVSYQQSGIFKFLMGYAFGFPIDTEYFKENNPANLIIDYDKRELAKLSFYIQCAPLGTEGNYEENQYLIDLLASKQITNKASSLALVNGTHQFESADRHIREVLPKMWQSFNLD